MTSEPEQFGGGVGGAWVQRWLSEAEVPPPAAPWWSGDDRRLVTVFS
jgi:hypothetical protein